MRRQDTSNRKYEKITISFTEADGDIVEYVKALKKSNKASEFIREAIREKIEGKTATSNENVSNSNILELTKRIDLIEKILLSLSSTPIEVKDAKETDVNNHIVEEIKDDKKLEEKEREEKRKEKIDESLLNALDFFDL